MLLYMPIKFGCNVYGSNGKWMIHNFLYSSSYYNYINVGIEVENEFHMYAWGFTFHWIWMQQSVHNTSQYTITRKIYRVSLGWGFIGLAMIDLSSTAFIWLSSWIWNLSNSIDFRQIQWEFHGNWVFRWRYVYKHRCNLDRDIEIVLQQELNAEFPWEVKFD